MADTIINTDIILLKGVFQFHYNEYLSVWKRAQKQQNSSKIGIDVFAKRKVNPKGNAETIPNKQTRLRKFLSIVEGQLVIFILLTTFQSLHCLTFTNEETK